MSPTEKKFFFINALISIVAIFITQTLSYKFQQNHDLENRTLDTSETLAEHSNERDSLFLSSEYIEKILVYRDYYTVDWKTLKKTIFTPYPCQYSEASMTAAEKNRVPHPCIYWSELQAAKTLFNKLTWRARIFGSDALIISLNNVQNGFDEVFEKYVNQEYYLRSEIDAYQEIMPKKFDQLEKNMREEIRKH